MNTLFVLNEIFTNGYRVEVLDIISIICYFMWNTCYY